MIAWLKSKLGSGRDELRRRAEDAYRQGAADEARRCCLELLRSSPSDARALLLLASVAADTKDIEQGLSWARRALEASPGEAPPHYAMGRVWEAAGRYPEAEASYRTAVELDPRNAKAHNNLGAVLHMQGRLDAALDCYRKALEIDPALPQANQNYAAIARNPEALEVALQGYLRHTAANPRDAAAFENLAYVYDGLGRSDEALASFDRAIALDPQRAETHFGRALVLLARGEYAEGWKEYDWRWKSDAYNAPIRRFAAPVWQGEARAGQTILLHGETGLGDTLMFVRYAPLVAERCANVVLECQPQLKSLLATAKGVGQTMAQGEPLPAFDAHIPFIALPRVLATTLETIPWSGPYVQADPARVSAWRSRISSDSGRLKAGLAWATNPENPSSRKRSLTLETFAPLASLPQLELYSLQKGEAAAELAATPPGLQIIDLGSELRDFSDTAAVASLLDLVITVDTSVAHLAGAMGLPTWVLLSYSPDWKYHLRRSDNPWYPTMRLFRQPGEGDWGAVVAEVAEALQRRPA